MLAMHRPNGMGAPLRLPQHQSDRTPSKPPGAETHSPSPRHPRAGSGSHPDPRRLDTAIRPFETCIFPSEQRSRIRDGRRVDTTGGLACTQTTLRHWRAPHILPSRAPYGHGALLRRAVGGDSTPGEVCMVAPSPQDCGLSPDRLPADAGLKAYLPHPCGVRIAGTDTAPAYTYTMTFSMVPIATAYSMAGEPMPSNLRPAAAPLDPSRTEPAQADAPGATRPPPFALSFAGHTTRKRMPPIAFPQLEACTHTGACAYPTRSDYTPRGSSS